MMRTMIVADVNEMSRRAVAIVGKHSDRVATACSVWPPAARPWRCTVNL